MDANRLNWRGRTKLIQQHVDHALCGVVRPTTGIGWEFAAPLVAIDYFVDLLDMRLRLQLYHGINQRVGRYVFGVPLQGACEHLSGVDTPLCHQQLKAKPCPHEAWARRA